MLFFIGNSASVPHLVPAVS